MLVDTEELARGVVITIAERIVLLLHRTAAEPHSAQSFGLVGESNTMRAVRAAIERAAASDVPVLLRGETGSGKELVAKAIAKSSQRRRPYVTVNMSAIIPDMAPAEFFGVHRKSATGVDAREGIFAEARGGTLFLDEIGLAHVQVLNTLLRALDSGEIQRVGSKPSERPQVNVRLISATDTNLERAISQGTFSQAVLQRLGSYQIMLPPLRERREDLGSLLVHFLRAELAKLGQQHRLDYDQASLGWLRASLVARIAEYPFPGNVRELRNLAQALAVHSSALSEARLPEDWTQKLSSQDYCENTSKTHPPSVNLSTHEEPPLQPPPSARQHQDTSDEEFRQIARNCKYSKSSMASLLHWDRRLVDKRCKALGMRSVKEITKSEFAAAVRRLGWDWDRLADHFEISKKSLQDAFGAPTPNGYRLLPDE